MGIIIQVLRKLDRFEEKKTNSIRYALGGVVHLLCILIFIINLVILSISFFQNPIETAAKQDLIESQNNYNIPIQYFAISITYDGKDEYNNYLIWAEYGNDTFSFEPCAVPNIKGLYCLKNDTLLIRDKQTSYGLIIKIAPYDCVAYLNELRPYVQIVSTTQFQTDATNAKFLEGNDQYTYGMYLDADGTNLWNFYFQKQVFRVKPGFLSETEEKETYKLNPGYYSYSPLGCSYPKLVMVLFLEDYYLTTDIYYRSLLELLSQIGGFWSTLVVVGSVVMIVPHMVRKYGYTKIGKEHNDTES